MKSVIRFKLKKKKTKIKFFIFSEEDSGKLVNFNRPYYTMDIVEF